MPTTFKENNSDTRHTTNQSSQNSTRNSNNNVTILNAGNLDRDREHLISINTNHSDLNLHKQTIRVKNIPSSTTSQNQGQYIDNNHVSPNVTTVTTVSSSSAPITNPTMENNNKSSDRIVLQIHSSSNTNNNLKNNGISVHNNFTNYASTVNPNVNFRKTVKNIECDNSNNFSGAVSTVFSDSLNTDYTDNKSITTRCSLGPPSGSSIYPDSDIILSSSSSRNSSTRSGTALIQDDYDDYLPTSLPHSMDDIINTNNSNTKLSTSEVFANSIAYPTTTAKSNPHCPNCNGVVPLNHLETISETAASKIEHGFWNHNYNNFHSNLHRESSFHSYGGFTLNGQPGYLKPNKHKMRRFCSSHKVAFVVSTFSLLVTIGLIITLLLMKKKGMMEAMR